MKAYFVFVVFVVLLLVAVAGVALAAPSLAHVATPFNGTLQGSETNVQHPELGTFTATGNVSGTATQLGTYTLHYQVDVNVASRAATNGTATFTAANGDRIFAKGHGQGSPSGVPGVGAPTEWYSVTGGTGRFAGASGSYTVHRKINQATGVTWGTFDGTILIPQGK